jgi:hypothetical protein
LLSTPLSVSFQSNTDAGFKKASLDKIAILGSAALASPVDAVDELAVGTTFTAVMHAAAISLKLLKNRMKCE